MVLSDLKVPITEQSQGYYANSKGITKGGTTRSSPKTHIILTKNKRQLKFIPLKNDSLLRILRFPGYFETPLFQNFPISLGTSK